MKPVNRSLFVSYASLKSLIVLGVGFASPASAALLLDHSGGAVLGSASFGDSNKDDGLGQSAESFDAPFFGAPLANPFPQISFNGHIYFGNGDGEGDYAAVPFGTSPVIRISPMWTDLAIGATSQVVQTVGSASAYNAITWVNMEGGVGNEGFLATFQAIYFNTATTIGGLSFVAGDIVFSYGDLENFQTPADVMIGLDGGDEGFATLPGYEMTEGWASYGGYGDFPVGENEYVRFRPNGNGYDVTIQAIPEPSGVMLLAGGGTLLLSLRRRQTMAS